MEPKLSKDYEANLLTGLTMDIERFLTLPACTEGHRKIIDALKKSGLARFIFIDVPTWSPETVIDFFKSAKVKGNTLTARVSNMSVLVKPETLTHHFGLPKTGEADPLNIEFEDEAEFWRIIAKKEDSPVNFSGKTNLLKDEFHLLANILSKIVECRSGSHYALTRPRAQLMYAIWNNIPVNWALFVFRKIADQVGKETKDRLTAENPPKGIFHSKKTFGIIVSHMLSLMGIHMKETIPVHYLKRLFGKTEEGRKRRSSSSPAVEKKQSKKVRKLVISSPSGASSTAPAKEKTAEEVRSSMGEAHEEEQAREMAQDPPHVAQDPTATAVAEEEDVQTINVDDSINIDEKIQRFNAWLSWKLSRSRAQGNDIERMHKEEDWIMESIDCYELFELVDTGKLLEFFKVGAAAHKRLAIKRGKRPEGEWSGGRPDGGDDDDDAPQPPQPQPPTQPPQPNQPQNQTQEPQPNVEETNVEEKNDSEGPKDDVPEGQSRADDEEEEEELNDPIGYNSLISSVDLITIEEEDEEEEKQEGKGLELVVYQGPCQFTDAAHHLPSNPSTSIPPTTPATSTTNIHAHLNEVVKVLLERMEQQNAAIKDIMNVMQGNIPRDMRLKADMCVSLLSLKESVARNTKDLNLLTHAVISEIPDVIEEQTRKFDRKMNAVKDELNTRFDLLKLGIANNSLNIQHAIQKEALEQNLKIDAQNRKLDAQGIQIDHMVTAIQDMKTSQESLTKTLLQFLDDAKKGEGAGISKEQRSGQHQQQQHHQSSSGFREGTSQPKTAQKPCTETVTPAEMEEFKKLFRSGH
ncbi:hypothetical protein Dimus_039718 [Dionaea muscipula]